MILVDSKEPLHFSEKLKQRGLQVEVRDMEVGDYVFGDWGIERKTMQDFYNSIISASHDKTHGLWRQLFSLKDGYPNHMLLIQGCIPSTISQQSRVDRSVILSGLASVAKLRIPVMMVNSEEDLVDFLNKLHNQVNTEGTGTRPMPKLRAISPREVYENMLVQMPGIGPRKVKLIAAKYPTVSSLATADAVVLDGVEGITPERAEWIVRFIKGTLPYTKDHANKLT